MLRRLAVASTLLLLAACGGRSKAPPAPTAPTPPLSAPSAPSAPAGASMREPKTLYIYERKIVGNTEKWVATGRSLTLDWALCSQLAHTTVSVTPSVAATWTHVGLTGDHWALDDETHPDDVNGRVTCGAGRVFFTSEEPLDASHSLIAFDIPAITAP